MHNIYKLTAGGILAVYYDRWSLTEVLYGVLVLLGCIFAESTLGMFLWKLRLLPAGNN